MNGNRLERELNARGLMLPPLPRLFGVGHGRRLRGGARLGRALHALRQDRGPALSLRVVLANGELIETVEVPRHAVGPELTQLFVGSEGTLGMMTQVTLQVVPLPGAPFRDRALPPIIGAGVDAIRPRWPWACGRRWSACTTTRPPGCALARGRRGARWRLHGLCFEGEAGTAEAEEAATLAIAHDAGASELDPALAQIWWDRRYDFYVPPHQPVLPSVWGTIDVVATYAKIEPVYHALRRR